MKWEKVEIGKVCDVGRGSSPRPIDNPSYFLEGTIPWVKIADATASGKYIYQTKEVVNEFGASFSRRLQPGALIVATSGVSLGQIKFLGVEGCIHDGWLYVNNFRGVDKEFLYYYLLTMQDEFLGRAYGAAIQNINTKILRESKINLPPLPIQRRIASILSAYDDLIENNLKRIKLLEEKVFLRYKGIVRNEKMERKKLKDVLELKYGKSLKADDRKEGNYPVYGSSGEVGLHEDFLIEGPGIIVGRKGNIGSVFWSDDSFWPIDTVYYIESDLSYYFLYFNLKEQHFVNTDAAVPGLNRHFALDNWIDLPIKKGIDEFDSEAVPVFQLMNVLRKQNTKLRAARDILLPRLMSGQIEV